MFFRSENLETAFYIIKKMMSFVPNDNFSLIIGFKIIIIPLLIFLESYTRNKNHPFENLESTFKKPIRWAIYYIFILTIIRYAGPAEQFIYFQF